MAAEYAKFREVWGEDPHLTARQAFGIAAGLDYFADAEISRWLSRFTRCLRSTNWSRA